VLVIANPIAGRGRARGAARELVEGLLSRGLEVDLHLTGERGDGRRRVRSMEADTDLVVSVGGDGTLGEVLDGLTDRTVPVAVLPLGTGNCLALDLALPRDVDSLLEVIFRGHVIALDAARVNGHLSFLVAGIGLDARVTRELDGLRDGPITRLTWARAAMRALRGYRPAKLNLEIDGKPWPETCAQVLISNTRHYAGIFRLSGQYRVDDGLFEVYLFPRAHLISMIGYLLRGSVGLLPGGSCKMIRASRIRITADEAVPCQVDGDYRTETPIEVEVTSHAFTLLVP
jgi:YegS/Rv2252/BmrU family lipid kinase